ncbi:MAG: glycosyltransferase [Acidobacteriota bacterium]
MKDNKILVFYPHNIFDQNSGINNRYLNLLKYFRVRGFDVDIFSINNGWRKNTGHDHSSLISDLYVFEQEDFVLKEFLKRIYTKIKKIFSGTDYFTLPDLTTDKMKAEFRRVVSNKKYNSVMISYINWANLIDDPGLKGITKVLDLSDFTTHQLFEKSGGKINIGAVLDEEIRRVDLFDKVMTVSDKEQYLFSQFCEYPEFHSAPIFMDEVETKDMEQDLDILIVGSKNPHNVKGLKWFFEKVFDLIGGEFSLAVAGELSGFIPYGKGAIRIKNFDNPSELYSRAKVALSPLLSGSGMKVKVVEALSFGLPVVTTGPGSAGINGEMENGVFSTDDPAQFASYIKKLLSDNRFYKESSDSALSFFKQNFSNKVVYKNLDSVFINKNMPDERYI